MLPDWVTTYVGGGILIVLGYIVISNSFWLILGSSIVQRLPGVYIKGAKGTLKIALLILLCMFGVVLWVIMLIINVFRSEHLIKSLPEYLSSSIQTAGRLYHKMIKKSNS